MADEIAKIEQLRGTVAAHFGQHGFPVRVDPGPPPETNYRRIVENAVRTMPPEKIAARPQLGPIVDEARELLANPNASNEALLDVYSRMMRVPPSS